MTYRLVVWLFSRLSWHCQTIALAKILSAMAHAEIVSGGAVNKTTGVSYVLAAVNIDWEGRRVQIEREPAETIW